MRIDPEYLTTLSDLRFATEDCQCKAFHVLKSSVVQLNKEATNNSFPNRVKWRMTSICGCGWSRRVFRFSMPQVIPAGLAPRWHRHNEDRHIGSNERQPFYRLKRLAQVPSSRARDTNSIYLLPVYCLSCSAFHLDIG